MCGKRKYKLKHISFFLLLIIVYSPFSLGETAGYKCSRLNEALPSSQGKKRNEGRYINDSSKIINFYLTKIKNSRKPEKKARWYYCLGSLEKVQGNFEKAINFFSKSIEQNGNLPWAYSGRAKTYLTLEEYSKALEDSRKVQKQLKTLYPGLPVPRYVTAKILYYSGDPKSALREIEKSSPNLEKSDMYLDLKGDINMALGNYSEAYYLYNKVLSSYKKWGGGSKDKSSGWIYDIFKIYNKVILASCFSKNSGKQKAVFSDYQGYYKNAPDFFSRPLDIKDMNCNSSKK